MRFGLDENIISEINRIFEANSRVDKTIVFGSRAKGNYRPDSDIDLAVKGFDLTLDDILKMQVAFEEKGIEYKIDLIDYSSIKEEALVGHIDRVGIEMYSRWRSCLLGEACEIITGFPFKGEEYEATGNLKVVRGENVTIGKLRWDSEKHWNKSTKDLEKYFLAESDIVIGMDGSRVGANRAIIRKEELPLILAQRVARLRAKKDFDQKFIWYNIYSNAFREYVESIHTGTSIPHISQKQIADFKISAPGKKEQMIIGEILSSLDNKIDLLHCQNQTLEQLAETLFKQWFIEEAEDTWEENVLEKYISFDPREKIDRSREYQFFEMKCLSNVDMNISDGIYRSVSSASSFRNFDTLLAKITPCLENGKTGFVMHLGDDEVARGSTEFIVMRSKELVSPYWIYCLARDNDFREKAIQSMTGTSGRQRVQIDLLKNIRVKVDTKKMKEFHAVVSAYFSKIKSNQIQIRTLTQLRDVLLLKLMTGEVRVAI